MLVLLAMLSMLQETFWTRLIASAKPAIRSPSWTTRSVRPEKMRIVSSIAARPWSSLLARLLGEHPRLVGRIGDPRLVGEQPAWSPPRASRAS